VLLILPLSWSVFGSADLTRYDIYPEGRVSSEFEKLGLRLTLNKGLTEAPPESPNSVGIAPERFDRWKLEFGLPVHALRFELLTHADDRTVVASEGVVLGVRDIGFEDSPGPFLPIVPPAWVIPIRASWTGTIACIATAYVLAFALLAVVRMLLRWTRLSPRQVLFRTAIASIACAVAIAVGTAILPTLIDNPGLGYAHWPEGNGTHSVESGLLGDSVLFPGTSTSVRFLGVRETRTDWLAREHESMPRSVAARLPERYAAVRVDSRGFPFRCVIGALVQTVKPPPSPEFGERTALFSIPISDPLVADIVSVRLIPVGVVILPLIGNLVVWWTASFTILATLLLIPSLRRAIRRRDGKCERCGTRLDPTSQPIRCPECGAPRGS
jgi:hypothetical protein